jgi:hypothetical protein
MSLDSYPLPTAQGTNKLSYSFNYDVEVRPRDTSRCQVVLEPAVQFRWRGSPPASSKINSPCGPLRVVISPKGTYGPKEPPSRGPCTCAKYIFCRPKWPFLAKIAVVRHMAALGTHRAGR